MNKTVGVVGAGAWGCALAIQAVRAGNQVVLWARDPALLAQRRVSRHLSGCLLPDGVTITGDWEALPAGLLLLAVPVQHLRQVLRPGLDGPVLVCAKGVEAGSHALPLEIVDAVLSPVASGVLTGPNFAHEVARGLPAAAVIATDNAALRKTAGDLLGTSGFRLYGSADPIGAQIGGAAKNVIAIAAGAVIGAGLGENARAGLVTRSLAEIGRLAVALGGRAETTFGLSGLGDLLLTCTGSSSRNFSLGLALGAEQLLVDILAARTGVTEGVATAPALVARAAALGLELPVCSTVAALVERRTTVTEAIAALLARPRRDE